jgi:hypothetical protein
MEKIQKALPIVGVMLALSMVAAVPALADEWLAAGAVLTAPSPVDASGVLTFEDSQLGVELECSVVDEGTVGPGADDSITKFTATSCKVLKGMCSSPAVDARHLPWRTEIVSPLFGGFRDEILSSGVGQPGWDFLCFGLVLETCEGSTSTALTNLAGGTVSAVFDSKSAALTCSGSGKTGFILGKMTILSTAGVAITVS